MVNNVDLSFLPAEVMPCVVSLDVRIDAVRGRLKDRGWVPAKHRAFAASSLMKGGRVAVFRVDENGGDESLSVVVYSFDGANVARVGVVPDTLMERPAAVADMVNDMVAYRVLGHGERAAYLCGRGMGSIN